MLYLLNKSDDCEKLQSIVEANGVAIYEQFENDFGQVSTAIKTSPNLEKNLKLHRDLKNAGLYFKVSQTYHDNFIN